MREILRHDPPLENRDNEYDGTPLGRALHGSEHGWHCHAGDYAATVEALLEAGATPPAEAGGTEAVRDVLRRHGVN